MDEPAKSAQGPVDAGAVAVDGGGMGTDAWGEHVHLGEFEQQSDDPAIVLTHCSCPQRPCPVHGIQGPRDAVTSELARKLAYCAELARQEGRARTVEACTAALLTMLDEASES